MALPIPEVIIANHSEESGGAGTGGVGLLIGFPQDYSVVGGVTITNTTTNTSYFILGPPTLTGYYVFYENNYFSGFWPDLGSQGYANVVQVQHNQGICGGLAFGNNSLDFTYVTSGGSTTLTYTTPSGVDITDGYQYQQYDGQPPFNPPSDFQWGHNGGSESWGTQSVVPPQTYVQWLSTGSYQYNSIYKYLYPSTIDVPGIPTNLNAQSDYDSVIPFSWSAPSSPLPITGYTIKYSNDVNFDVYNLMTASSSPVNLGNVVNGITYYVIISASNTSGNGPYSAAVSAVPSTVPTAPTNLTAIPYQNTVVPLSWGPPNYNGGLAVTSYIVSIVGAQTGVQVYNTQYTYTGLTNGITYNFSVSAVNANPNSPGPSATISATPSTVPTAPNGLTAASNQNTIVPLNWSAPSSDGGSPIDYYVVWYGTDPTFASYTALVPNPTSGPVTIHGLLNGTLYYFQVFAHNASGNGATASTSATPSTTPDAPTDLAATWYQNGQVPLSWTAPYDDGGSSITDYKIQYKPSLHSAWNFFVHSMSSQTSITVTGLINGTSYDFRVAAANVNGVGLYSAEVSAIPSTVPDAPVNLKVVPGNSQVYVSWSDGPSDGGSPITNYKIEYKLNTTLVPPGQWSVQYSMTTTTIYFLKNGSLYNFQVRAINASGLSNPSTMVNATPSAPLTTSCGITNFVPGPPLWSRAGGNNCPNCVSNYGYVACGPNGEPYSTYALDQRRKAEILKYRNNSAQLSPAMFYSMISRNAFTRKKSWATQTQTYTNPNVNKLPEIKNASGETVALQCNQPPVLCSLSSGSDVPGPVIPLCIDESVPLYNYKMQVTNASGGNFESFTTFQEPPQPQPIPAPVPPPPPPISNQIYFNTTSQTITTYIDEQGGESQIPVQGGSTVVQIRVAGSVVTFNFTSSGSSANQVLTRVVCVGGGGAGGLTIQSNVFFTGGGGGGAGGFQDVFTNYTLFQNYTCFVGTGGQNPIGGPPVAATSSYVDLATQQMTCYAGGCGLGFNFSSTNPNGGSGGGSWTSLIPGTGVSGQGFDGGGSVGSLTNPRGGGGGGASEVGLNSINGGDGGNGVSTSIFPFIPTGLFLAGGGGAGTGPNYQIATGGIGGGGNSDTDAVQWTGGGGGGQSKTANSRAGNGGDGFIAFSFPSFVP